MSDEAHTEVKPSGSYRPRMHWIEAVQWLGKDWRREMAPKWMVRIAIDRLGLEWPPADRIGTLEVIGDQILVGTPRGVLTAEPGDWIVRGPCGALGVIPGPTFAAIYEPVEEA